MIKKVFKIFLIGLFFLPLVPLKAQIAPEREVFYINSEYDIDGREKLSATLKREGKGLYIYIENEWWNSLDRTKQSEVKQFIQRLDYEFYFQIKPILNENYGLERSPGIDGKEHIIVLIHEMDEGVAGYFRSVDEYSQSQASDSNEHEMVYLNASSITSDLAKSYLAHEFTHLITFNQKDGFAVEEETWLNEARAEYAPTLVGYNEEYENSYLQKRVNDFLKTPSDSITEWTGKSSDYGSLSLFAHYLVEQYGVEILKDSLQSKYIGIESLNKALEVNSATKNFAEIFTDWTITALVNDCSLGELYCYKNKGLRNTKVVPLINFLPLSGKSTLGVTQETKDWSGNWFKFIGGKGTLKLEFIGETDQSFKIPYIIQELSDKYSLGFFNLNDFQRGAISVSEFGTRIGSITIIPSIQTKLTGFTNSETSFPFFWEVSTEVAIQEENINYLDKAISVMNKEELLSKVNDLERLLGQLNDQIAKIDREEREIPVLCQEFKENLYYGLKGDSVSCLQQFLRTQEGVYPEGLVTGNFFTLTINAVIRFQEKYFSEILAPLDLERGTGFVGSSTRSKLNELLGF